MTLKNGQIGLKNKQKLKYSFANHWTNFVQIEAEYYQLLRDCLNIARHEQDMLDGLNEKPFYDLTQIRLSMLSILEDGRFDSSVGSNIAKIHSNFADAWSFLIERERKIYDRVVKLLQIAKNEGLLLDSLTLANYERMTTARINLLNSKQEEKFGKLIKS
jgi:hypothetical protein